ncbi:MAG: diguanylate cyclase [Clostridia bacterium]|nr:diguanylate cyclase [Clostridia bacterium]
MKGLNTYFLRKGILSESRNEYLSGKDFEEEQLSHNVLRGKLMAIVTIAFEVIFFSIAFISCLLNTNDSFAFNAYLFMYLLMISLNLIFLLLIRFYYLKYISPSVMNAVVVVYLTLVMTWGSVISLMDQRMYAQLITFMINMAVSLIIYLLNTKKMLIPFLISTAVLAIGLPFFQPSSDILIGHYVNLSVFIVVFWIASRIVYHNYCDNYVIKKLMDQSELRLKNEMEEKKFINEKLAEANEQLKKMALMDELTGLPNRRSYGEFIETMFLNNNNSSLTASVIMMDIDFFKQYNDTYGHDKGDLALVDIAGQIYSMVEDPEQIAVRWGGEEFIYMAFNKSQDYIYKLADSLRIKIMELKIPNPGSSVYPFITISMGVCTGHAASREDINTLIKYADKLLYQAKDGGRNRVIGELFDNKKQQTKSER